jgi:hypothetical protein
MFEAILIGAGATAFLDLWSLLRSRIFGARAPDYALLGRWIAWMPRGRFVHASIARETPVRGERLIGWTAHYLTGIGFTGVLLAIWGTAWATTPTLLPALIVGAGSVVAPFLLIQPAMGLGIAASRTPDPRAARLRTLTTHTIFGFGLYLAAAAARLIGL